MDLTWKQNSCLSWARLKLCLTNGHCKPLLKQDQKQIFAKEDASKHTLRNKPIGPAGTIYEMMLQQDLYDELSSDTWYLICKMSFSQ